RMQHAVSDVVKKQVGVGLDIINDGEFGKESWSNYILKRITGFEIRPDQLRPVLWLGRDRERFAEYVAQAFPRAVSGMPTEACVGPIKYWDYSSLQRGVENLKSAIACTDAAEAFMT